MTKTITKSLFGVLFAIVSVLLVMFLFQFGFFQSLERKAYDAMMTLRGVRPHTNNIVVVKIDEYTMKELEYPIPRDKWGSLLAIISQSGAAAIGVDEILATVRQDSVSLAQNDQFLMLHEYAPRVFYAIGPFVPSDIEPGEQRTVDREAYRSLHRFSIPQRSKDFPFLQSTYIDERPFPELADLAAGVGHILLRTDSIDGIIRSVPFFVSYAGDYYPTFGAALAFAAAKVDLRQVTVVRQEDGIHVHGGPFDIPLLPNGDIRINYAGTNDVFTQISFQEVLDAFVKQDAKALSIFKNAVVIIGPTARSIGDHNPTPMADISPNCFVHANVYDQIMTGNFLSDAPKEAQVTVLIIMALIVSIASILLKLKWSAPIGILLAAGYLWFAYSTFTNTGVVYYLVEPMFALFFCYASSMSYTAATEGRQKAMIKGMFERYVDRAVVRQIIDDPSLVKLGGEEREITTLFADIEGFTSMSEKMGPQNTVGMLNSYLTEMSTIIIEEQGTIDKYIGDAIMAFWGAPLTDRQHAYHACCAALKMQRMLESLHTKWIHFGRPVVNQRIGINTGRSVVGNMGAEARLNYTAIGDAVNLASRLEGVNKEYGTRLLMSGYTYAQVRDKVLAREMDLVVVVGKTEPVRIYELIALADEVQTDATKKFLEHYHNGLEAYKKRAWKSAVAQFQEALTIRKDDIVSNLYIQRSTLFIDAPPPEDWNGVFVMTKK